MSLAAELDIPETGAIFTFGKSHFADNEPSHFFIKNDPVTKIYCGDDHTAVICQQGRVFAFGSNNHGQLGLGHTDTVERPACLKWLKPRKAKQVACGRAHSIILTENNQLFATGDNTEGQLGTGCTESQLVPQFVEIAGEEENTIKQIAAGAEHTLALFDDGNVYGCGSNSLGQLGLGEELKNATSFTKIEIDKKIKLIDCGYYHSVFVTDEGEAYIFGDNENQRLGVSDTSAIVYQPTLITMGLPIMKAYCGHYHTFFLSESYTLFAVGSNEHGQLGLPRSVVEVNHPTEVNFDKLFDDHSIEAMSCGATHTAFVTDNGYLFTCGDSTHSKLCLEENSEDLSNNNTNTTTINQYLPKRVAILEGFHVHDVSCGGCHTIISAVKIVRNDNNNLIVENLESLQSMQILPELPPLQKVPLSIMNKSNLTNTEEADVPTPMKVMDTINGNDQPGMEEKASIHSMETNVNDSQLINNLQQAVEKVQIEEIKTDEEQIEQILIVEKINALSEDKNILIKQETIVEIIEKTVVEDNVPVDIAAEGQENKGSPENCLQVPETVQYSPIMSTKSESSQKTVKSSNGSHDSENETIVCNSEKSTPLTKTAKTQAVIPILRTDEMVATVETNAKIISDDSDVMHSKVTEQEGKISKFFNGLRNESCMGKSRVISSVDVKEQAAHETSEVVADQTNSRACVIL